MVTQHPPSAGGLSPGRFVGCNVLVTGAATGIGLATARLFAGAGARVLLHARTIAEATAACAALPRSVPIAADLRDEHAVALIVEAVDGERIDVIVNNAGMENPALLEELTKSALVSAFTVNVFTPMLLTSALLPNLELSPAAAVINVTSIHESIAVRGNLAYTASKAALAMFTKTAALEWAPKNIRVNSVAPGAITTDMNRSLIAEIGTDRFEQWIPARRLGGVDDVAAAIAFLASPEASYINGTTLIVDGGYSDNFMKY